MRILGIDYGSKRWGLAYGDELGVATPLPALLEKEVAGRWAALAALVEKRRVTELVVGHPLNMDDSAGFMAKAAEAFAADLRARFNLPVELIDERLTSYEAESDIAPSRRRQLRASGLVDSRSATLILQDFLNTRLGLL